MYIVGDVHADLDRLKLLLNTNNLINHHDNWIGKQSKLFFVGDFVDRGPYDLETIQFVRELQRQAYLDGGKINSCIGNHDALFVSLVLGLEEHESYKAIDPAIRYHYYLNGGKESIIERAYESFDDILWLSERPMMIVEDEIAIQHADSISYYKYLAYSMDKDDFVEAANEKGQELMSTHLGAWEVFGDMTDRRDWDYYGRSTKEMQVYLDILGAKHLVHGHSRHDFNYPVIYYDGLIANIDGSMSCGYRNDEDRGFIYCPEL